MSSTRVRAQSGLTIVELMVSATLLLVGALATFSLVDVANSSTSAAASREVATNIARQVLEDARATQYTKIGQADWLKPKLEALQSDAGAHAATPTGVAAQQTTVVRRKVTYTVAVAPCAVDDSRDSYGTHSASIIWCSDSTSIGTNDPQPEDMKRVAATISWTIRGKAYTLKHTATFGSSGVAVGPGVSTLAVQSPAGMTAPYVVSSASTTSMTFRATSIGAADMKFTLNGAEQQTNITNNNNGTWDWTWSMGSLPDGTYTVGAVAIDALGTRGQPYTIQVTLNRNVPAALTGLVGGYNYVFSGGVKKLVVELNWDANVEGNVTGYEVLRGATSVCGGQTSQSTECLDLNAPSAGTTAYTVKTWYRNAVGSMQSISTTYNIAAPGAGGTIATRYYHRYDTSNPGGTYTGANCKAAPIGNGNQNKYDALSTLPALTGVTVGFAPSSGCIPPLPQGAALTAGTFSFTAKWVNTSSKNTCSGLPVYLYLNGTTIIAGSGIGGGNTITIPAKTNTQTTFVVSGTTTARNFSAGDQLSVHTPGSTFSANCSGVTYYFNNTTSGQAQTDIPLTMSGTPLPQPSPPTGLTATPNGDGTTTLSWTNATGTPAPDFYRVYRDGQNYTNRVDTVGPGVSSTVTWTDTSTGGTSHTYYVTTAASTLAESSTMAGPVSG